MPKNYIFPHDFIVFMYFLAVKFNFFSSMKQNFSNKIWCKPLGKHLAFIFNTIACDWDSVGTNDIKYILPSLNRSIWDDQWNRKRWIFFIPNSYCMMCSACTIDETIFDSIFFLSISKKKPEEFCRLASLNVINSVFLFLCVSGIVR